MPILTVGVAGYATIQLAVNAAADGDTIVVEAGTYVEQVVVTGRNGLTIVAAEGAEVTMRAPDDLHETARSSSDREIHSIFTAINSSAIRLEDIRLDGHGTGNTVDEGGGAGIANFYGSFYRNASGTLENVDVTGIRDPYPPGLTPGGQPNVDGVQRGISVVVDNDSVLPFAMHGGTIDDFQKQAGLFVRANLDISGVTVLGGGAQPVIAQNGFSIQRSTGTVSGNSITGIGYAGPAEAYSGGINASSNFDLAITGNTIGGSNVDNAAAKVVGIWIFQIFGSGLANSGGLISGNTISHTDVGIAVDDSISPNPLVIENNIVLSPDLTDPYSAGVRFEPMPITLTTPFDIDGTAMHDVLSGNAGDDILFGLAGVDTLRGNGGNDTLDGSTGADSMTGGAGDDIYFVDEYEDTTVEAAGEGTDEVRTALGTYVLAANVENLTATSGVVRDFRGNAGNNTVVGSHENDLIRLGDGGDDRADGMSGNDILYFGKAFTGADRATGGDGRDVLVLQGDYALTLSSTSLATIEVLSLQGGASSRWGDTANASYDYAITMDEANVAAGTQLIVNAQSLVAGESVTFDGSRETDGGMFLVYGGYGTDDLTGGAGNDIFYFEAGRFGSGDTVDGGGGRDAVVIGGYGPDPVNPLVVTFAAGSFTSVEALSFNSRFNTDPSAAPSYAVVLENGNIASGGTLIVNASSLGYAQVLDFDGSAVADGALEIYGGYGADTLSGGANADTIMGAVGADLLSGGGGGDIFRYDRVADSYTGSRDTISAFETGSDRIDLSRIDANVHLGGDQAFRHVADFTGAGAASAGELRIRADLAAPNRWFVEGDTNGDGRADLAIALFDTPLIIAADIVP
ncbi:MAG TPA: calcium-binding protein [Allosphingosinicella sp.]